MAKLAAVVDDIESVDETHRDLYVERDGKYVLDADGVVPEYEVLGLKSAHDKSKLAAREAKERLDAVMRELADLKRQSEAGAAGITQETLDRWNAERAAEIAAKDAEIAERDRKLRVLTLDDQAKRAFLDAGGKPDRVAAAMKLNAGRYDLNDQGAVIVLDAEGKATGASLIDHFAKTFRAEMPELYAPSGAGGGGAPGGGGSTNNSGNLIDAVLAKNTERASAPNALRPQAAGA